MQIGLRQLSASMLAWFLDAVGEPDRTRCTLACELGERESWFDRHGMPCLAAARKLLPRLAAKLGVSLPAARETPFTAPPRQRASEGVAAPPLCCKLAALGTVTLRLLQDDTDKRRWDAMMAAHHPQGWARSPNGISLRIRRHFLTGAHGCRVDGFRLRTGFRWVRRCAASGSTCCGASSIAADMTALAAAGSAPQGSAPPSRQWSRPVPPSGPAPAPPDSPPSSRARS